MNHTNLEMTFEESHIHLITDRSDVTHCDLKNKSILKPAKVRAPLQEVDLGLDNHIDFDVVRKRRVSFAGVNKIKEFNSKAESVIICSTPAYEESFSTSSDSSALTASVVTINGGKEAVDDCTLLNDTMELTDIQSESDVDNMMDITALGKPQSSQGKEEPANGENVDPNSRKMQELPPKAFNCYNMFSMSVEPPPQCQNPVTFVDPAKILIKEFLEDSNADIIVDMSLVGNKSVIHYTGSKERKDDMNDCPGTLRSNVYSDGKHSNEAKCLPHTLGFSCGSDLKSVVPNKQEAVNINDDSAMEITEQLPIKNAPWEQLSQHMAPEKHFPSTVCNKALLPDPQQTNYPDMKNSTPIYPFHSEANADLNKSEDMSIMEFTEAISEKMMPNPQPSYKPEMKNIMTVHPFNLAAYTDLNKSEDMSQMEITETIVNKVKLAEPELTHNLEVKNIMPVNPFGSIADINMNAHNGVESKIKHTEEIRNEMGVPDPLSANNLQLKNNFPFHAIGSTGSSNLNRSECSKSQMEFTEAINNKYKMPDPQSTNNLVMNNIPFPPFRTTVDSNFNPFEFNKSEMEFTEAIAHKEKLPEPLSISRKDAKNNSFGSTASDNLNTLESSKSQMEFTEAISNKLKMPDSQSTNNYVLTNKVQFHPFDLATGSNRNESDVGKSQMEFTETVRNKVKLPDPQSANNSVSKSNPQFHQFAPVASINQNTLDSEKSQMEFTEAISNKLKPSDSQSNNNPIVKSSPEFHPFSPTASANLNTFGNEKSQMEFTEAISNKLKLPDSESANNYVLKSNIQFHPSGPAIGQPTRTNHNSFDADESHMDFTEAISNKLKLPDSQLTNNHVLKNSVQFCPVSLTAVSNQNAFDADKSQMEFTEAISNKVKLPNSQSTSNPILKNNILFQPFGPNYADQNAFDAEKSQMEFTEAISNKVKHPIPHSANSFSSKNNIPLCDTSGPASINNLNPFEINKSQMEFTEAISNKVMLHSPCSTSNPDMKNNIPFHPFGPRADDCNLDTFHVDKSQMDFTEAISNRVKLPDLQSVNNHDIKNNMQFHHFRSTVSTNLDVSKDSMAQMDFTEAVSNNVKLPNPQFINNPGINSNLSVNLFGPVASSNFNIFVVEKSQMESMSNKAKLPHPSPTKTSHMKNNIPFDPEADTNLSLFDAGKSKMELYESMNNIERLPCSQSIKNNISSQACRSAASTSSDVSKDIVKMDFIQPISNIVKLPDDPQPTNIPEVKNMIPNHSDSAVSTNLNEGNQLYKGLSGALPSVFIQKQNSQQNNCNDAHSTDHKTIKPPFCNLLDLSGIMDCTDVLKPVSLQSNKSQPAVSNPNNTERITSPQVKQPVSKNIVMEDRIVNSSVMDFPEALPQLLRNEKNANIFANVGGPLGTTEERVDKFSESDIVNTNLTESIPIKSEVLLYKSLYPSEKKSVGAIKSLEMENKFVGDSKGNHALGYVHRSPEPSTKEREDFIEQQEEGCIEDNVRNQRRVEQISDDNNEKNILQTEISQALSLIPPTESQFPPGNEIRHTQQEDSRNFEPMECTETIAPSNVPLIEVLGTVEISKALPPIHIPPPFIAEDPVVCSSRLPIDDCPSRTAAMDFAEGLPCKDTQMNEPSATDQQLFPSNACERKEPPANVETKYLITMSNEENMKLMIDGGLGPIPPKSPVMQNVKPSQILPAPCLNKLNIFPVDKGFHSAARTNLKEIRKGSQQITSVDATLTNISIFPKPEVQRKVEETGKWNGEEEWNMIKRNRSFMSAIEFKFVSPTLWKYSFPWPLDLLLHLPMVNLDFSTKKVNITLVKRKHNKADVVGELAGNCMKRSMSLILSESWLNSDCSTIDDVKIALALVKEEYVQLQPLISSTRRLFSYFPFALKDFRIQLKMVNLKQKHLLKIKIDVEKYKKLSGSCIEVTNIIGRVRQEDIQKLFDQLAPNDDRLVNFVKAVNHLLAYS